MSGKQKKLGDALRGTLRGPSEVQTSESPDVRKSRARMGRPPRSKEREQVTVYLSTEVRRALRVRAATDDREQSEIVEEALRTLLGLD